MNELTLALRENRETLVRILEGLDSVMTRLQTGQGTLGRRSTDPTRYVETAATLAEPHSLLGDLRLNPRKYYRFSGV